MSYCRFENTLSDLQDCIAALRRGEIISKEEMWKAQQMRDAVEDYIDAFEDYEPNEEEDDEF